MNIFGSEDFKTMLVLTHILFLATVLQSISLFNYRKNFNNFCIYN